MNPAKHHPNEPLGEWKVSWIDKQIKVSRHPPGFWEKVIDQLIEGRESLESDPLVPIGRYAFDRPDALEFLVERNNRGIGLEQAGKVDASVVVYEVSVNDEFFGTHPYDRLRILYTNRGWYDDAIRVCQAYLALPKRTAGQNMPHFEGHLEKLIEKRRREAGGVVGKF